MKQKRLRVLALDLEGTLISDGYSVIPRPGLSDFLQWCDEAFERVVLFTCVSEDHVREIAQQLVREQAVPPWFQAIEVVEWYGAFKDLNYVDGVTAEEALLVDDKRIFAHPKQQAQLIPIPKFQPNEEDTLEEDTALEQIRSRLAEQIRSRLAEQIARAPSEHPEDR